MFQFRAFLKLNAPDANATTTKSWLQDKTRENESNNVVRRLLLTKLQWQPTIYTAYGDLKAHVPASTFAKHEWFEMLNYSVYKDMCTLLTDCQSLCLHLSYRKKKRKKKIPL